MVSRAVFRNVVRGLLAFLAVGQVSPDARACSCVEGARLNWPAGDQTNVPLDTSIITSGFGSFAAAAQFLVPATADAGNELTLAPDGGSSEALLPPLDQIEHPAGLHLVSPAATIVPFVLDRTLPTVDCVSNYRFFRQESGELEANTTYQLYEGETFVATFTTGAARREVDAEIAAAKVIRFETLGTTEQPSRITTAYVSDVPATVAFVHYDGALQEVTYRMNEKLGAVATYEFGGIECPLVEIVGMDGAVLDARNLCEPDRCKGFPDTVVLSSCGGNYLQDVTYDEFKALPACTEIMDAGDVPNSADASAPSPISTSNSSSGGDSHSTAEGSTSSTGGETSVGGGESSWSGDAALSPMDDEHGSNKVPLEESVRDDGGCSVSVAGGVGRTSSWLIGLAMLGLVVRRHRR